MVVIVFDPTFKAIGLEAVPDVTAVPFTFTVEVDTAVVGVMVMVAAPLTTAVV